MGSGGPRQRGAAAAAVVEAVAVPLEARGVEQLIEVDPREGLAAPAIRRGVAPHPLYLESLDHHVSTSS